LKIGGYEGNLPLVVWGGLRIALLPPDRDHPQCGDDRQAVRRRPQRCTGLVQFGDRIQVFDRRQFALGAGIDDGDFGSSPRSAGIPFAGALDFDGSGRFRQ